MNDDLDHFFQSLASPNLSQWLYVSFSAMPGSIHDHSAKGQIYFISINQSQPFWIVKSPGCSYAVLGWLPEIQGCRLIIINNDSEIDGIPFFHTIECTGSRRTVNKWLIF